MHAGTSCACHAGTSQGCRDPHVHTIQCLVSRRVHRRQLADGGEEFFSYLLIDILLVLICLLLDALLKGCTILYSLSLSLFLAVQPHQRAPYFVHFHHDQTFLTQSFRHLYTVFRHIFYSLLCQLGLIYNVYSVSSVFLIF